MEEYRYTVFGNRNDSINIGSVRCSCGWSRHFNTDAEMVTAISYISTHEHQRISKVKVVDKQGNVIGKQG